MSYRVGKTTRGLQGARPPQANHRSVGFNGGRVGWIAGWCAAVLTSLTGCATPGAGLSSSAADAVLTRVRSGQVTLDCGVLCAGSFIFRRQEFAQLYQQQQQQQQRWRELALATVTVNWRQDITYFYLGAAAEGLQYYAAAEHYYRWAGGLATGEDPSAKCVSTEGLCAGLVFPRDINIRLHKVAKARQAAVMAQMADTRLAG